MAKDPVKSLPEGFFVTDQAAATLPEGYVMERRPIPSEIVAPGAGLSQDEISELTKPWPFKPDNVTVFPAPTQEQLAERRKYKGIYDELAWGTAGGLLGAASAYEGTMAWAMRVFARNPAFWHLTKFGPVRDMDKLAEADAARLEAKAQELYDWANQYEFQPSEGGGVSGFVSYSLGQTLPMMAMATAATAIAGPAGGWVVGASIEGDSWYREALANGATPEEAAVGRVVVGAISGTIEMAQVGGVIRVGKAAEQGGLQAFKAAVRDRSLQKIKAMAGRATMRSIQEAVGEGFEEVAQLWVAEGAAIVLYDKEFDWKQMVRASQAAFAGGASAGWLLGSTGLVIRSAMTSGMQGQKTPMAMTEDQYAELESSEQTQAELTEEQANIKAGEDAVSLLKEQLQAAKAIAPRIRKEQSEERSRRVGAAAGTLKYYLDQGIPATEARRRAQAKLAGPLTRYEQRYESIRERLGEETIETLHRQVLTDPKLRYYEQNTLSQLLDNLIDGDAITMHEAQLLGDYYGRDVGAIARKHVPFEDRGWFTILEILNLPRTLKASMDISGAGRQGWALSGVAPESYGPFVLKYLQAFWSEDFAVQLEAEYKNDPAYQDAKDANLEMPEWGRVDADISELSEEFAAARLIQWIPGVRASERSFVTALNWMRLMCYTKMVSNIEAQTGRELDLTERRRIASRINGLGGRSSLPKALKGIAPILNAAFFSPRFALSRVQLFRDVAMGVARSEGMGEIGFDDDGKATIVDKPSIDPGLKVVLRGVAGMMVANIALMTLIRMMAKPEDDVQIEPDLRATDGGNIRVNNQRYDFWAGYSKTARFMVQFATGQIKTKTGEIREVSRSDILKKFIEQKGSPLAGIIRDWWRGYNMYGKPFGSTEKGKRGMEGAASEAWDRLSPMVADDVKNALEIEGVPAAIIGGVFSAWGAGVQTYEKSGYQIAAELKSDLAQTKYGKSWNDLKMSEQLQLRQDNESIAKAELDAKKDRFETMEIDRHEEVLAGRYVYDHLSEPAQKLLDESAVRPEIQRTIGKQFWLNRDRWKAYQNETARVIDDEVQKNAERLLQAPEMERAEGVKKLVSAARRVAAQNIVRKIEDGEL